VGWQIAEAIRAHARSAASRSRRAVELLGMVGIPRPSERVDDYPHQFSGGMRQRVMIAMALALSPALIIADEPTTGARRHRPGSGARAPGQAPGRARHLALLITHDLGVVADLATRSW